MLVTASAVAVGFTAAACGGSDSQPAASSSPVSVTTTTTDAAAPASQDTHNEADVMFAQHMIPHHQQAVEMSDMVLAKDGVDERVVDLAEQIKAAQDPEISLMQGWLEQWGVAQVPMTSDDGGMPGHDMGPDASMMPGMGDMPMEGMMSATEMAELQNAQGVDASRLFLEQMIRHHEGAITMARTEIDTGEYPDAVELAQTITVDQQREIDLMNEILASL